MSDGGGLISEDPAFGVAGQGARSPRLPGPAAIVVWLPAVLSVLLGLPTLLYPFGRDQGNYAYAGWVVLEGGAPYRDVFVFKPPMTVLVHSLSMALFGVNTWGIRVLDLGWTALTASVVALIGHRLTGRRDVALWAGAAVPVLYFSIDYWNIAQSDGWMNLPATAAVLLVLVAGDALDRDRRRWALVALVLAGVLLGVAALFKYTAVAVGLPVLLLVLGLARRHGARLLLALPVLALGAALPLLATWGWLVTAGAWPAFLDSQTDLVPTYVAKTSKTQGLWAGLSRMFTLRGAQADVAPLLFGGVLALIPAAWASWWAGRQGLWTFVVLLSWWGVGAASLLSQGKFFDYHYLPLLPASALLLGLALPSLIGGLGERLPRALRWPAVALLFAGLVAASPVRQAVFEGWSVMTAARTVSDYRTTTGRYRYRDYNVGEIDRLVAHLQAGTGPDDTVFVWGFDPTINVQARRRTVSRFLYNYPFRVSWGNPAYEAELMAALQAHPPDVFVVASKDATPGVTGDRRDSARLLRDLPALRAFVDERYVLETTVGRYRVYRLPASLMPG